MDSGERLNTLERGFERISAQLMAIDTTLRNMASIPSLTPPMSSQITNTIGESDVHGVSSKLKPASPSDFDGDRTQGRAFLNSCELYIRLSSCCFPNEESKVYWAFTYMKSGRAHAFADRAIRYESQNGYPRFSSWMAFRTEFIREFFPRNEAQRAITCLETSDYFQGEHSVDEYIDTFKDLIDLSTYTEVPTWVRHGDTGLYCPDDGRTPRGR